MSEANDFAALVKREPLSREELRQRAYERVKERPAPYWCFLWNDESKGVGCVNFVMPEQKAEALFRKTHPRIEEFEMIGKDA